MLSSRCPQQARLAAQEVAQVKATQFTDKGVQDRLSRGESQTKVEYYATSMREGVISRANGPRRIT